jgi:hypothetical protein
MTEQQQIDAIFSSSKKKKEDERPFWKRLLCSLRIVAKPGTSWKEPVKEITLVGKAEF